MSSIENPSTYVRNVVKKLPAALIVALMALIGLSGTSVFAQEGTIQIIKTPATPAEVLTGGNLKFTISVVNNGAGGNLTNVVVADDKCPGAPLTRVSGDDGDNVLEVGETWLYECTVNNILLGFINKAEVQAVNAASAPVSDSDVVEVKVLNRGIHVTKTAVNSPIVAGQNAVFNVNVRNTSTNVLKRSKITVNDAICTESVAGKLPVPAGADLAGDNPATPLVIEGGSINLTCTVPNVTNDTTNTASVSATDEGGLTFTHFGSATVVVLKPGIAITKAPNAAIVATNPGTGLAEVIWTLSVYNTGQLTYDQANVFVNDFQCGAPTGPVKTFADADNLLETGERWLYTCTISNYTPGIYDNTAFVNTIDNQFGQPAFDSTTASVTVLDSTAPILLEKNPPLQFVLKGQTATFQFQVRNNTNPPVALSNVKVEDALCTTTPTYVSGDTDGDGKLDANYPPPPFFVDESEVWTFTCSRANVQDSFLNYATVKADANGIAVSGSATSIVTVINPSINIEKKVDPVLKGQTATFQIRVTNKGNAELSNVTVTDALCETALVPANNVINVGDIDADGKLDPAEAWTYNCTDLNVQADYDNTASVTAKDPLGNQVSANATAKVDVIEPKLHLEKIAAFATVNEGDAVKWELRIRNTGQDTALFPVVGALGGVFFDLGVSDALCPTAPDLVRKPDAPGDNDNDLEKNEIWIFDCTAPAFLTFLEDEIINTAVVAFRDAANNVYSTSERSRVQVISKGLDVQKTASPAVALVGTNVDFTFTVRNFTNPAKDLQNVTVTDAMCSALPVLQPGSDVNGDGKLNQNETWIYKCTVNNVQADFTNTATADAKDANGNPYRDTASITVVVVNAKLNVIKSTTTPIVDQGATVIFTIQVKNTGAFDLNTVVPTDAMCQGGAPTGPTGDNGDGKLNPNEVWTYSCTVPNAQNNYVNTVIVTAKEPGGQTVTGNASASVTVLKPSINLSKTANQTSVQQGSTAFFTVIVSNGGSTDLTNVVPLDAFCPLVEVSKGNGNTTLEVGETWVYTCAVPNVQSATGTFVNVASVTANGGASASDDASVIVINTPPPGNPGIDVEKTPDSQVVAKNSNVTFGISVSNSGAVALNPVSVTDPLCTLVPVSLGNGNATLDVGETWTYTCTVTNVKANLTNTASASGTSAAGQTVSDSDSATVTIAGTKIKLEKSPKTQTIVKGSNATFLVTLNNPTAENLTNVVLSDPQCTTLTRQADAPGNNDAVLNSGETWRWSCTITNVQKSFTNKAKVTVIRPSGKKLTANASAKIIVKTSSQIRVTTSPEDVTALRGSNVPLSILVTNIGKGNLVNVTVSHSACAAAPTLVNKGNGDDKLASGETWTFACTVSNIQSEVSAAAVATATDEATGTVEEADALVDIEIFNEADEDADDEAAEAPTFKIFTPLIAR